MVDEWSTGAIQSGPGTNKITLWLHSEIGSQWKVFIEKRAVAARFTAHD